LLLLAYDDSSSSLYPEVKTGIQKDWSSVPFLIVVAANNVIIAVAVAVIVIVKVIPTRR
jgi:hypothetical protein